MTLVDNSKGEAKVPLSIGDRATSDVIVRLRTDEGRDSLFYCHSQVLIKHSKYFANMLSEDQPTCPILDFRRCMEIFCRELDFNFHVIALRLLYVAEPHILHGARNALGILRVAVHLCCFNMAQSCIAYLESMPWEEAEEEEILRTIPTLGPQYQDVLARLRPVDPTAIVGIFNSAIHFATSFLPTCMEDMKKSTQEQLEYMLTKDDDTPLLSVDNVIVRSKVVSCTKDLLSRFDSLIFILSNKTPGSVFDESGIKDFKVLMSDIAWLCRILCKMEMMKDLVKYWVTASCNVTKAAEYAISEHRDPDLKLRTIEVAVKVLEAIASGNVVLPTSSRLHVVKVWLPFVQRSRTSAELADIDGEIWQDIESAIVSILLALPSGDQADFLAQWLSSAYLRYPDLTEVFEVWCFRSKAARRRPAFSRGNSFRE